MKIVYQNNYCEISIKNNICLVKATSSYIPINDFKEVFDKVEELTTEHKLNKLIFDKRNLSVFHQPSMEWYFVDWKERVYNKGLVQHRKILPKDPVFRECVKLGREKIYKNYPDKLFNKMDIAFSNSIEEAIKN